MDTYEAIRVLGQWYVDNMRDAKRSDEWDEQFAIRREMKRMQQDINKIVMAVDVFARYDIKP